MRTSYRLRPDLQRADRLNPDSLYPQPQLVKVVETSGIQFDYAMGLIVRYVAQ
jgi:hypothetical protein